MRHKRRDLELYIGEGFLEAFRKYQLTPDRRKMFGDNQLLVFKMIQYYSKYTRHFSHENRLHAASISLWRACAIYDPKKGRLSTIAFRCFFRLIQTAARTMKIRQDSNTRQLLCSDAVGDPWSEAENLPCVGDYQNQHELKLSLDTAIAQAKLTEIQKEIVYEFAGRKKAAFPEGVKPYKHSRQNFEQSRKKAFKKIRETPAGMELVKYTKGE